MEMLNKIIAVLIWTLSIPPLVMGIVYFIREYLKERELTYLIFTWIMCSFLICLILVFIFAGFEAWNPTDIISSSCKVSYKVYNKSNTVIPI